MTTTPLCIDFETWGIESRPKYPPEPIGVSLKEFGQPAVYLAWGHKTNNNTTKAKAIAHLKKVTKGRELLAHNSAFDLDVLETHCGVKLPPWQRIHDTMWLLFLYDPNMKNLGLKPSSEEILGWPSDERDAVADWLCSNQPVPDIVIKRGPKSEHFYMKYLAWAPGDLVGAYARGDVERTEALFEKLHPNIIERGMSEAYNRERRLMPVLLAMERRGVRIDLPRLRTDVAEYQAIQRRIDEWLCSKLNKSRFFNLDSDQFVDALAEQGFADKEKMGVTETGKVATNKAAISAGVTDRQVAAVLQYRAQLHTAMATFMEPWLRMAETSGGLIYTTWNQVRGSGKGARTGRLSSSPNLQNIPKSFQFLFSHEKKGLPKFPFHGFKPLPLCRSYVIPYEDGHVLIDRDFSQQEIRILAHMGDGELLQRYKDDAWMDAHDTVRRDLKHLLELDVSRDSVKAINFGIIYALGVGSLAERLGVTTEEARRLKKAVLSIYPEVEDLYKTMRVLARQNKPLVTWGNRENYCEPPTKAKDGSMIDWSYKMVNCLVQGSAGDSIKESMIRYSDAAPKTHYLLLNVHDQLLSSVPKADLVKGHWLMQEAMVSLEFDVPMLSEGKFSENNWADLQPYDKKGVVVAEGLPEQRAV